MLLKCYSQYTSKFGKQQWPQISFHSNSKEGQCQRKFKLRHNYTHFTCQQGNVQNPLSRPQIYMNQELLNVQAGFRKGKGSRDQIANISWIIEKAREFQKNIYSASLTMLKLLTVWIITNYGKLLKRWEYQTTLPAS